MIKHKITDKEKAMVNVGNTVEETKEPVIPVGDKYMLTIKEASDYFSIGEKKLRRLAEEHTGDLAVINGNRYLIIRTKFEQFLLETSTI
jgi:excisionase family DNA binding protein